MFTEWILHIWISQATKFQLKLTIFSFNKIYLSYFQLKTEQAVQGLQEFALCVANVNSAAVFEHFKDLKNLIILSILKAKLVISCLLGSFYLKLCKAFQTALYKYPWLVKPWLNFNLNFSFKFCYSFTGQLKNLPKLNLWW